MTDFVLIHSTGQGAAGWGAVVRELANRDHWAHAVELPDDPNLVAGEYAELVRQQVGDVATPVVLAHSGSGPLLPAAARTLAARLKGANIGVAAPGREGWEDRRHGFLLPLPRRPGRGGRACS